MRQERRINYHKLAQRIISSIIAKDNSTKSKLPDLLRKRQMQIEEEERKLKKLFGDFDSKEQDIEESFLSQNKDDIERLILKNKQLLSKCDIAEEEFYLMDFKAQEWLIKEL